jgi:hypothetical protein|tara:strand:+ start:331 stop:501 length:171 start_codon:yes stop_codon:yes gene_type:complete
MPDTKPIGITKIREQIQRQKDIELNFLFKKIKQIQTYTPDPYQLSYYEKYILPLID